MKWLCRLRRLGLCRGSCSRTSANGTFPIAASKYPSGSGVCANDSARIVAWGWIACAIRAVLGSSSTPVSCAPAGASPMNVPAPAPGSSTRPAWNPRSVSVCHIACAIAGSV